MIWALLCPPCLAQLTQANTQGWCWKDFQDIPGFVPSSQCYGSTESPWSRGRMTLQQCLGGDTAARLCSRSGKSKLKVPLSKVGNNSPSHEECGFWELQSGTKKIKVASVPSEQWLLNKECAARASPRGVPQGPVLASHAGRTSLRDTCMGRKDTDLHPGKRESVTLKSASETPLTMPLFAIPEQASTLLSTSSTFFFSSIILHNYTKKRKNILYKKL